MSKTAFPTKAFFFTAALGLAAAVFTGCAESGSGTAASATPQPTGQQQQSEQAAPVYDESLVRVQKVYGEGAAVGEPYEFQILVTALKPTTSVLIRQALPESVDFLSSYPSAQVDDSGAAVWDLGAMEEGDQRTLNLVVVPSQLGNFAFRTTVKAQPKATEVVRVGAPDLAIHLQQEPTDAVDLGGSVTWKLLVTNNGSVTARQVRLGAVLPSGFEVSSGNPVQAISRLLPGQSAQLVLTATPAEAGVYSANFTVNYDGGAPVQRQSQVLVRNSQARLVVSGAASEYIFSPVTYTLRVINTGGTELENLTLVNDLPKGAVIYGQVLAGGEVFSRTDAPGGTRKLELRTDGEVSGYWQEAGNPLRDDSAGQVQWVVERLAPGESAVRELTYYSILPGAPENHARVITSRGLSARDSVKTEWKAIPGIYTSLVDSVDPVQIGEAVTYTATVGNQSREGTITVRSLEVRVPDVLRIESAGEGGRVSGNTVVFNNIELGPQEKRELTVTAIGQRLGTGIAVMETTTAFHAESMVNEQSISVY